MTILSAQGLAKAFGPKVIANAVTLSIEEGERIGLLGANGSGKSTLAKMLAGFEPLDGGTLMLRREATIGYLAQEPVLDPARTPREEVLAGLGAWADARARYDAASAGLGRGDPAAEEALLARQAAALADVERLGGWDRDHEAIAMLTHLGVRRPDAPIRELSGGDRRRVALARLLVSRPTLAILDEPSNHLDADTVAWLEDYLVDDYPGALLLVTHDRYLLDRVVTRTLELERGHLHAYDGGYQDYLEARAERAELSERTEANRQNFLRKELEWLRRQPKARTGKQKARIGRAEASRDIVRPRGEKTAMLELETTRAGKSVIELRGITLMQGEAVLVRDLELLLRPGERVGIVGPNGAGKTTLLRALLGEHPVANGAIVRGQNITTSYLDQHRAGLDDVRSIFDNVAGDRTRIVIGEQSLEVRSYLERFLFRPEDQRQPVGSLSGGERARVALAKMLSRPGNLVILDEPTNDLDVAMLGALEELLVETNAGAVVVTHDRWFLDRIATAILAFEGEGRVVRYEGNYQIYCALRPEPVRGEVSSSDRAQSEAASPKNASPAEPARAKAKLTFNEKRELEGLLDRIDGAEQEVVRLEAELACPRLYAERGSDVPRLTAGLEAARAEVVRLLARWEELESKRG
ncbi:MAG: ABC-F family ATP-binding cassette domain-containing protein [Deltaproteobacteria bacterium]|nr:ABC-F family ATP-binding cassette domain-containing protein [Deltaproteobacteria bacterium]